MKYTRYLCVKKYFGIGKKTLCINIYKFYTYTCGKSTVYKLLFCVYFEMIFGPL